MRGPVVDQPGLLPDALSAERVASADLHQVMDWLKTSRDGLSSAEAAARRGHFGPNSLRTHRVSALAVIGRQLGNAVLGLLAGTAAISYFLGDSTQAVIIGVILVISVGLGFLTSTAPKQPRQHAFANQAQRGGATGRTFTGVDVSELVPGDVIRLGLGELVPADVRLIEVTGLECNESILTGESAVVEKSTAPAPDGSRASRTADLAYMGTVVSAGEATAVVFATGPDAQFGRIAAGLGRAHRRPRSRPGCAGSPICCYWVALTLTVLIFVTNMLLGRPLIDAALFGLAIAVGITPQLLPAVVSTSLATGSRRLAKAKVLVKRLVCIEDLGDIDILITDKTGTLTEGSMALVDAVDSRPVNVRAVVRRGLLATDVDPDRRRRQRERS